MLHSTKVTSVEQFSSALGVSPATVRRDLNELHAEGRLRRVRGGAVAADQNAAHRDPYFGLSGQLTQADTLSVKIKEKRAIGKKAASLIDDNDSIIIDGGSTTVCMTPHIHAENLMVLTTSIPIMNSLLGRPKLRILIAGGEVFQEQALVLDPYWAEPLASLSGAPKILCQGYGQLFQLFRVRPHHEFETAGFNP